MNCLLKNAMLFHPEGLRRGDVLVRDGSIWRMAEGIAPEDGVETIDLSRCILMPGLVDVHVHFREPGFSAKETIRTGSLAAAHGGFTTVCTMPNLSPVPDCMEHLEAELDSIRRDAAIRVIPYGSITVGEMGEQLADMEAMAPFVAGFSDDGRGVQDEDVMHSAMLEA